ncbi:MAG: 50S ribosomal protein L4 [Planctomycetota bacterium]
MIEIPVLDIKGQNVGSERLDPALLGGRVRHDLLKQAVVAYRANKRQGTVVTKSRGMVKGSTRKLYRQKGTGRARVGNARTPTRIGGGRAFGKVVRDYSLKLPRKMRKLARDSAILAKAISGSTVIVDGIKLEKPRTSELAGILKATHVYSGALLAVAAEDRSLLLSGRNIPNFEIKHVSAVNAYDVLRARNLVFTPEAFKALTSDLKPAGASAEA